MIPGRARLSGIEGSATGFSAPRKWDMLKYEKNVVTCNLVYVHYCPIQREKWLIQRRA